MNVGMAQDGLIPDVIDIIDGAIDQIKLRAAYGETGSSASFGSIFTSLNSVSIGGVGGSSVASLRGDANIEPETSQEFEVGIDLRFIQKIGFEDMQHIDKYPQKYILINTLPIHDQECLIYNTLSYDKEEQTINALLQNYDFRTLFYSL